MELKIKEIKERIFKDKKTALIIILASVGILLVVLSEILPKNDNKNNEKNNNFSSVNSENYTEKIEKKLTEIISSVQGAGNTKVMVTLDTGSENVYARKIDRKNEKTDSKEITDYEYEYIIVKSDSSSQNGMLLKVVEPNVRGVAVVCEGGDDAKVREQIAETVSAVLNVRKNKISISKMK